MSQSLTNWEEWLDRVLLVSSEWPVRRGNPNTLPVSWPVARCLPTHTFHAFAQTLHMNEDIVALHLPLNLRGPSQNRYFQLLE